MQSVLSQTFPDWLHIIINDGGEPRTIDKLIDTFRSQYNGRVSVVHNPTSAGMENCSNIGLLRTSSEYVAFLDDDDSWSPTFLARTIARLAPNEMSRFAGVVTHAMVVREEIRDRNISTLETTLFSDIATISLEALSRENLFPNNSFVYRRTVIDRIGYYDGALPVLGDWEFNLRVLKAFDLSVIREPLAYYHQRASLTEETGASAYANTVVSRRELHAEYRTMLLNRWARRVSNSIDRSRSDFGLHDYDPYVLSA